MARAGTDEATVAALKELYGKILADEEVAAWLQDTMLLEVDPHGPRRMMVAHGLRM